jgi:hypothetical protein
VPVPATFTVPAGANSAALEVNTAPIAAATYITVTATQGGIVRPYYFKLDAAPTQAPALVGLTLTPMQMKGGTTSTSNKLTLSGPALTGGVVVTLVSSNPSRAMVPATVTIPAGQTTFTFPVQTVAVSVQTTLLIKAVAGTKTFLAYLTLTP